MNQIDPLVFFFFFFKEKEAKRTGNRCFSDAALIYASFVPLVSPAPEAGPARSGRSAFRPERGG
jgi:hypothetical protein